MRVLNAILMMLMILFIAVQYNDPDGSLWMAIYAVPAVWTAIAVFQRPLLGNKVVIILLIATILAAIIGLVYFWPTTPGWWQQEVWWETETAREGMGMMITTVVLMVVWLNRPKARTDSPT